MNRSFERLAEGNRTYVSADCSTGVFSAKRREETADHQHPFIVVITCSDSRVVPEQIFSASLGDLFTIRTAGNTIGESELASIEYALDHLHVQDILVLAHENCGAVKAALSGHTDGYAGVIVKKIQLAIGDETVASKAAMRNAEHSVRKICETFRGRFPDLDVRSAFYHLRSGTVDFYNH